MSETANHHWDATVLDSATMLYSRLSTEGQANILKKHNTAVEMYLVTYTNGLGSIWLWFNANLFIASRMIFILSSLINLTF